MVITSTWISYGGKVYEFEIKCHTYFCCFRTQRYRLDIISIYRANNVLTEPNVITFHWELVYEWVSESGPTVPYMSYRIIIARDEKEKRQGRQGWGTRCRYVSCASVIRRLAAICRQFAGNCPSIYLIDDLRRTSRCMVNGRRELCGGCICTRASASLWG